MTSTLPVLIPAVVVTLGWVALLEERSRTRWRMALFSASLAVFFLSLSLGIYRYQQFGINVRIHHAFVVEERLAEKLRSAVSIIELGVVTLVLHLLLAAWNFKREGDQRGPRS